MATNVTKTGRYVNRRSTTSSLGSVSNIQGTTSGSTSIPQHNDLVGLQGGTSVEYYHLTLSEHIELTEWLDSIVLDSDGSMTLTGNIIIPNNGTIGQAAGPLLTFDDTNNFLEVTGCIAGFGTAAPVSVVTANATGGVASTTYNTSASAASIAVRATVTTNTTLFSGIGAVGYAWMQVLHTTDVVKDLSIQPVGGNTGFGTVTPNAKIESLATTEQLRLSYDATHYTSFTVASTGALTITPLAGTGLSISCSGTGDFAVNTDDLYIDTSEGKVGINRTAPQAYLEILGTTEQLRLSYSTTKYTTFTVASTGALTVTPLAGQDLLISLSTTGDFVVNTNDLFVDTSEGKVGFGTIAPAAKIESLATTEQLRLSYDATHYTKFVVDSGGGLTVTPLAGQDFSIVLSTTGDFVVNTNDLFVDTSEGKIGIHTAAPVYPLEVNGITYFDAQVLFAGTAETETFTSGFQVGTGWQITHGGRAEFGQLICRGGMWVYELIINQLHYQNGGLIIGPGAGKVDTVEDDTLGAEVLTFVDPEGTGIIPFEDGAIVIVQRVDINRQDVVKQIVREVSSSSSDMTVQLTATAGWTPAVDDIGAFQQGDEVVCIGNTSSAGFTSSIYMSATDTDNPFLRVITEVTSWAEWSDESNIRLQIGNLASLASGTFGDMTLPASPGYGLFSDNVYLTGKVVLPNAGMTNEGALTSSVRIYAGDTYANRATAPFNVTQNGDLTATGVAELATNVGLDPESADTNAVAISGCNIYEPSRNDDTGSLYINLVGYQGETSKYRNTYIGEGKNGYLLQCLGEASIVVAHQVFGFVPQTFVSNLDVSAKLINSLFIMEAAGGDLTLTLPDSDDILTQFGAGKSAQNPMIIVINVDTNNNLTVTTKSGGDSFYTTGSDTTKNYILNPNCIALMVFAENAVGSTAAGDWYVLGI